MYCANCGVCLGDAEQRCPLCGTAAYHPDLPEQGGAPLYPRDRMPRAKPASKGIHGVIIFLFLFPLYICFLSDWRPEGVLVWFGYVAGALAIIYMALALPL